MANTLADMKARIARELARTDLTVQIAAGINDAIAICQKYRFKFSEAKSDGSPPFFATVAANSYYPLPAPGMFQIDYMERVDPTTPAGAPGARVSRGQPELVRARQIQSGAPTKFAIEGEQIVLGPAPDAVYTIIVHGQVKIAAPATDIEVGNRWMTDGERLIRLLAKREIARDVTRNKAMYDLMNEAFFLEGSQMISENDRLLFFEAMHLQTELVKGQQEIIAKP